MLLDVTHLDDVTRRYLAAIEHVSAVHALFHQVSLAETQFFSS